MVTARAKCKSPFTVGFQYVRAEERPYTMFGRDLGHKEFTQQMLSVAAASTADLSLRQGPSNYGFSACVMLMVAASAAASNFCSLLR